MKRNSEIETYGDDEPLVKGAFDHLMSTLPETQTEEDKNSIERAYYLAKKAHHGQRRKSGEPYILHPIEVARICSQEIGLGPTAIVAALLHDVVEDTPVTLAQIHKEFNAKIALIVDGLTKLDANIAFENNANGSPQADNFKKVLKAMLLDVRVVLIKMADRLHNMRTLGSMPRHKQLKISSETSYIYTPLAHRLGLYSMKTEFEDMTMKITDSENYKSIAKKLQETKKSREAYVESFIAPLKEVFDEEISFPFEIHGRPKSIHSIYNKIKNKDVEFDQIYDLFAIRIIVDVPIALEKPICWQIYSIVTDVNQPIPERLKDWITTPKSNGYESLHTTVIGPNGRYVEVQIRSKRMNEIAERGFAAHWKYKGALKSDAVYDDWLNSIRETLESADHEPGLFLSDLKTNLFNEEVFVYTPQGDMKVLPKGSTALDFAFCIHTQVGSRCAGIKMANRLVPLDYILQNGDQLEIITNKNQQPNEDWLKIVKTARARSKIRSSLRERRKEMADMGKEKLLRKLSQIKADYDDNIEFLLTEFASPTALDFFVDIYNDKIDLKRLKTYDVVNKKLSKRQGFLRKLTSFGQKEVKKEPKKVSANSIVVFQDGVEFDHELAQCCKPVPGDDIFGFNNLHGGVKIHRVTCPNAEHLMANYGYRIMRCDWQDLDQPVEIELLVKGLDTGPGVIERVSNAISTQMGFNIKSFYIDGKEGYFEGKIKLLINNHRQIKDVINKVRELDDLNSVQRI